MITQQEKVLALLREAGLMGVNSYDLTYKYSIKQGPTRLKELKEAGHMIGVRRNKDRSVTYILLKKKPQKETIKPQIHYEFDDKGFAIPKIGEEKPEQLRL
jgi:hypothetical protein